MSRIFLYAILFSVFVAASSKESYGTPNEKASLNNEELQARSLQLPPIFSSGMVLQQEDSVSIWGKNAKKSIVVLKVGWNSSTYKTITDSDGKWSVKVATPTASFTPYQMVIISNNEKIVFEDILIGDVWFVSGQSNMNESFRGFINQPVNNIQELLLKHGNVNGIRLFKVQEGNALLESDSITGSWKYAKIENVINFSAVGYVFGKTVFDYVNIPIGLVQCASNGSLAEAWLDKKSLKEFGGFDLENIVNVTEGLGNSKPTLQYNSMLHPLLPLRIKGVVWYQGEANVKNPQMYKKLFPFLINRWRDYFDNKQLISRFNIPAKKRW